MMTTQSHHPERKFSMLDLYRAAFSQAFNVAIQEAGLDALKRTSLFGSNDEKRPSKNNIPLAEAA
ncbi:hypothetical protein JK166_09090 [Gluconobacter kondonii]|nr:hypothetical protein [Gluconobacter kondonii]